MEKSEVAKKEEEILEFWRKAKIFEKTLEKKSPKGEYVFYDGPPFATGLPHFGHLLPTSLKDAIPRYQTMRGYHVARRWGWDCHGLPIENLIEKELGLKTKKDIEELGIDVFNRKARESVLRYAADWERIIPRMGRWVDMQDDYRTMDPSYTESVWWAFKTLHDKGLAYEGYKSMHLCPRCETTLANFEVNQGYKDITDLSVYVKFEFTNSKGEPEYFLAWTTTPWTLPGNVALAVNPKIEYVKVKFENNLYVLAKSRLAAVFKDGGYEVVGEVTGDKLVGKKYKTVFDYYLKEGEVFAADFVTTEDGTGIVHIAPAFGDDDMQLGQAHKLPFIQHVDVSGHFKPEVTDFAGLSVKPKDDHQSTDILIIKHLARTGALFAKEKIVHPYPHCWRCDTPLLNYAASSWFIAVTQLKDKLLKANKGIEWVPEYIKEGRFGKWLEGARDWAVSRARFWGAPLPVWRCADCEKIEVVGSLKELLAKRQPRNTYVVMRHGEAESNVRQIVSADTEAENHLTERGREQVAKAGKSLKKEKIDLIIASPVLRTKETAWLVAEQLGLAKDQIVFDDRLREVGFGDFEGQSVFAYHSHFTNLEERFAKSSPHGESLTDVKVRAAEALYHLDGQYEGKRILLVTHETVGWFLCAGAAGLNTAQTLAMKDDDEAFLQTAEFRPLTFVPLPHNEQYELDLHRPYIDQVMLTCSCGGQMKRVPDVFDVWFESGSMPFGQLHYPFENEKELKHKFPADFIAEGLDQTRGWFYVMLVLSIGLFGKAAYKRVIVNGLILAEDGQKMSKRLQNYPDLEPTINKYGADALRLYLLSSPATHGEEFNFSERGVGELANRVLGRLRNVVSFYQMYTVDRSFSSGLGIFSEDPRKASVNVLDRWIMARLNQLIAEVTEAMEAYELDRALRPVDLFVDDLSTWYLRRSRERFKSDDEADKQAAMDTTRFVLLALAKILAPFTPFAAEEVYEKMRGSEESVHLDTWPTAGKIDGAVIEKMSEVRQIVSVGLELRNKAGVKIRQPLPSLKIGKVLAPEFAHLIKEELNIKEIMIDPKRGDKVSLDTDITPKLKEEGELRDLIRELQDWRKEQGLKAGELVQVVVSQEKRDLVEKFSEEIKKAVSASGFTYQ